MTSKQSAAAEGASRPWGLIAFTLTLPTLNSALGIDGGAIFQILASETLRLDARVIGLAFGLGVLSIPLQVLAARKPLWRATRSLQSFLVIAAAQCIVLAALITAGVAGTRVAVVALVVTVAAEISLSVFFTPAWQPLLSFTVAAEVRQRINSTLAAVGRTIAIGAVAVFGAVGAGGRAGVLVVIAAVALVLALQMGHVAAPGLQEDARDANAARLARKVALSAEMRRIITAAGVMSFASGWPLLIVYADKVFWPTAHLGLLGATQLLGSVVAALAWRSTTGDLRGRAEGAGVVLLAASALLLIVRAPVNGQLEAVVVVVAVAIAGAARTVLTLSLIETAHRAVSAETAVRSFTLLDVVVSSSLQLGLLVAGFVVALSEGMGGSVVDPYRLLLLAGAAAAVVALRMSLRPAVPQDGTAGTS